jgi:septum formation protein
MSPISVILASASPRRAALLRDAGLEFEVRPAHVSEAGQPGEGPAAHVERLARDKAVAVHRQVPDRWVVGADTEVVAPDGTILGKPQTRDDAARMLRALSGATHEVLTGVAVAPPGPGAPRAAVARTAVTFHPLSDAAVAAYVATGEPMDKAGAYGIQGRAGLFVARLEGSYANVVGLPVVLLYRLMLDAGFPPDGIRGGSGS